MITAKLYRTVTFAILIASTLGFVSCVNGPTHTEALSTLPPIPKGKGRVFVYRESSMFMGGGVRPAIKIDDQKIGTSKPNGFCYSDQPSGKHVVSLTTEATHRTVVNVTSGQPSFVQTYVTPGILIGRLVPSYVDKIEGESAIQNCKLVTD
jgi:hypothetical protein